MIHLRYAISYGLSGDPLKEKVRDYGNSLVDAVKQLVPDSSIQGKPHIHHFGEYGWIMKHSIWDGSAYFGKHVAILKHTERARMTHKNTVEVHNMDLYGPIEQIVTRLNKETGLDFLVKKYRH